MPSDTVDKVLEQSVCQALSPTGISVEPNDLQIRRTKLFLNLNAGSRGIVFVQIVQIVNGNKIKVSILVD